MKTQHRSWYRLMALLFSFGLIAAACGSSDSSGDETSTEDEASSEAAASDEASAEDAMSEGEMSEGEMSEDAMSEGEMDAMSDGPLTMAIVAPSAANDLAFTQSMVDALNALDREIELSITDGTFVVDEAAAAIRGYAEDGIEVIVVHGTQFGGSLGEIAPDFPETTFIWGTATDTQGLDNVFAYHPAADQGGYVNGILAAGLSESGKIGVVGPIEAGDAVAYIDGFEAGATSEGATVNIVYTGSFGDVALAAETAEAHIANGSDVLTGTAQMVVGAVGVAKDAGVPWFGTQANQESLATDIVVASQVYHWEVVLEQMLELRDGGTLGGEAFVIDLANGGLVIEFNEAFELSDDLRAKADAAIAGIIDGSVSTGV